MHHASTYSSNETLQEEVAKLEDALDTVERAIARALEVGLDTALGDSYVRVAHDQVKLAKAC